MEKPPSKQYTAVKVLMDAVQNGLEDVAKDLLEQMPKIKKLDYDIKTNVPNPSLIPDGIIKTAEHIGKSYEVVEGVCRIIYSDK